MLCADSGSYVKAGPAPAALQAQSGAMGGPVPVQHQEQMFVALHGHGQVNVDAAVLGHLGLGRVGALI